MSASGSPYIIAEIGANHNGDMDLAKRMIREAKQLGCSCVKFQSFDERLFAKEVYDQSKFLDDGRDVANDLRTAVRAYSLKPDQVPELAAFSRSVGIDFSSSAFEPDHAQLLKSAGAAFIKIASMDVNNDVLLRAAAGTGLPIVLSTGMATLDEITKAVATIEGTGNRKLTILHCVSLYPPPDTAMNLNNIEMLRTAFGYPVGFSDHTLGLEIALAAIAKGAVMIEKHFTLDKKMEGWDHGMSADPAEMSALVKGAQRVYSALGSYQRHLTDAEVEKRKVMRRSIVSARAIKAGQTISADDLTARRPGTGLEPQLAPVLVGMVAARDIAADTRLSLTDVTAPKRP